MTSRYAICQFQVHTQHTLSSYCFFMNKKALEYNCIEDYTYCKSHKKSWIYLFGHYMPCIYNRYREQSEEPELGKQVWPQMTIFLANKEYANNLGKYCLNYLIKYWFNIILFFINIIIIARTNTLNDRDRDEHLSHWNFTEPHKILIK